MNAVAITDTANLHGCHEFYKACKWEWIKPLLWVEIYTQSEFDEKLLHKLVLLAKNIDGYRNLLSLCSKASLDNPWNTARILFEDLKKFSQDIICLSWPISGEIPYYILSWKSESETIKRIQTYQEIFGKENYFLEILYHQDIPKQELITKKLIDIAQKYNVPLIACQNSYYIEKEDTQTQDVIMALWTGHEIENPDRPTLINGDYSFLTSEEMTELFGYIPEALQNTQKVADMIDIEIETWGVLIPTFTLPKKDQEIFERAQAHSVSLWQDKKTTIPSSSANKGCMEKETKLQYQSLDSDEWYLRYLAYKGLNWRYNTNFSEETIFTLVSKTDFPRLKKALTETDPQELKELSLTYYSEEKKKIIQAYPQDLQDKIERLEYELVVVHEMWFNAYFLIVADYIWWARKNHIPVGPGRWSAAGSLMAFLTGITDIDPLPYDLLFERFLNPARVSMPDIDTDFSDTDRDRVVEYCRQKYGEDRVAQICTFGTFAARAAVKDVGRVMGVAFQEMNKLGKLIPEKPGTKLSSALEEAPEFREAYETNPKYKIIIDNALKIEGNVRQLGVHACAVIIAPEPMTHFTALARPPKDTQSVVTQYSAYPLEDLGLLKMDFLWLRNLTIIKRTQEIISFSKGKNVDILDIPLDDKQVYKVFSAGDTTGVFQFESDGMRKYLKDLSPDSFEDLIAMVSLYRPWPLAYIPSYVERKHEREAIEYMLPELREILEKKNYSQEEIQEEKRKLEEDLKKILDVTYGIAVYQEQLMFIVQYMAGFSLGEADILRRWVWKKKAKVVAALKKEFIEKAAVFRDYKTETSTFIYEEMIQPAANYSFNKSHAACYALIAYQTAYLKAHYRTEFLTSMMISDEENMDRIILEVAEAKSHNIEILRPDINESLKHFTYIDDSHIRFWLKAIKWLWDGPIDAILAARKEKPFENIDDFVKRWGREVMLKKSLEAMILAWAMDQFGERADLFANIDDMIRMSKNEEKKKDSMQMGLFDSGLWWEVFDESFSLRKWQHMTYEERLFWEREVLGYMVSGHPLDGLRTYISRRSRSTQYLQMRLEELQKIYQKDEEKFEQDLKKQQLQTVGIVMDIRKVVTKTGKNMLFLYCESYAYDFEVTIFDRDYDEYKDTVTVWKIVIVEWSLDINFEYRRKNIRARKIITATLTQLRAQARDMNLFDTSKRDLAFLSSSSFEEKERESEVAKWEGDSEEVFEKKLEAKIEENKYEKVEKMISQESWKYIVEIPQGTSLDQIHDLKDFLSVQEKWEIHIFILLWGREVDTKFVLESTQALQEWEQNHL